MAIKHFADIGSISIGTLRDEDLLETFAFELKYQIQRNRSCKLIGLPAKRKLAEEALRSHESEFADELVQELIDALNDFAPPYAYFGALEGDGADFGFWPEPGIVDSDEVLPRFSEAPAGFSGDCLLINDHGNVTCCHINGNGKTTVYWSCV